MNERTVDDIELAALVDGSPAGTNVSAGDQTAVALVRRVLADRDDSGPVPVHLVRHALDLYPRQNDLVDLVLAFTRDAVAVVRASLDVSLAAPEGLMALRKNDPKACPMVVMTRTFPGAKMDVHIERLRSSTCTFTLRATDTATSLPLEQARVDLFCGRRELASGPFENGTALFEGIGPGRYDLVFRKSNAVIGTMTVKIVG